MKRVLIALFALSIVPFASLAQPAQRAAVTIKGRVIGGDDGQPVIGAYVINNAEQPDFGRRMVATDASGNFTLTSREAKNELTISFMGYQKYVRAIDPAAGRTIDLGAIRLQPDVLQASEVTVVSRAPMATMKGDTIQYNAAAFKTNPDASSEDLLAKMPGVIADDNGGLTVHGQSIGKVTVDGKDYFADDPATALKNLPADVVESMQIFDDRSDASKFSGFDDGERIKAINIVTKGGVSQSMFGKAYLGYGTDDHYSAGVAANIFNLDHRFTILGQTNNINNQGFTLNDIAQSMGGGGGVGGGQFATNVRGGLQTTNALGLNYQGEFNKKLKIGASYFFDNVNAEQRRITQQDYISMPRNYYSADTTNGHNYQHRLNARVEWNPNETNRIFFSPRVSYATNHGNTANISSTLLSGQLSNGAVNRYSTDLGTYNVSGNLWWMHRLEKPGRTFSLGGTFGAGNQWGDRYQRSIYSSLDDQGVEQTDEVRQLGYLGAPEQDISGRISYTEPLSEHSRLTASYRLSYNTTESDKRSYDWDPATQDYDILDPLTSNYFDRDRLRQTGSVAYNYVQKKLVLNANLDYQHTDLNDQQTFPQQYKSDYQFNALLPRLRLEYKPSNLKSVMLNYERTTDVPSMRQLQEVIDLTDPLRVYYGNPELRQSYSDRINVRYNAANLEKSTNFFVGGSLSFVQNYIANNRRFLTDDEVIMGTTIVKGAQVSTPVNLNGYVSGNLFSNYSFRLNPLKSNMHIMGRYGYYQTPSMENNVLYRSRTSSFGGALALTSNISEGVDFTVRYSPSVNLTAGTTGSFDRYVSSNLSGFLNVFLWGGFFINADATWRNTVGTRESYTQHYALLNAGVGYKFLKYKQAEFRLSGYDLLNQNRSIWQNSYDTYVQLTQSSVLKRYYMLSFTYKFDTRKNRSAANFGKSDREGQQGQQGRPAGGPRMGGGGGYGGGGYGGGFR